MVGILNNAPFVSIVMPVYNGGHYFEMALQSALSQNYGRFEIVVIDDGSKDDRFAERVSVKGGEKVRYFYQENAGVAGALNNGLAQMRGDIFCWLSHDDLFEPHKLMAQVQYFSDLAKKDAVLFSDYDLIDPNGAVFQNIRLDHAKFRRAPISPLLSGAINGCTIFAPADVMRDVGEFELSYRYTQDYRFWNRLLKKYDFFHQPESLVRYRVHPQQGSNHPQAIVEGDDLWIQMIKDRSEIERVQMTGSSFRFFEGMATHLAGSPYRGAERYARQRANDVFSRPSVSVIVPVTAQNVKALPGLLAGIREQGTRGLDVILATTQDVPPLDAPELRVKAYGAGSEIQLINQAMMDAKGDYIVFQRPGREQPSGHFLSSAQRMMVAGTRSVFMDRPETDILIQDLIIGRTASEACCLENLMIHRIFVDGGAKFNESAAELGEPSALVPFAREELTF
jgi:glycosyltransferase involved in cell wall biosynthesis